MDVNSFLRFKWKRINSILQSPDKSKKPFGQLNGPIHCLNLDLKRAIHDSTPISQSGLNAARKEFLNDNNKSYVLN